MKIALKAKVHITVLQVAYLVLTHELNIIYVNFVTMCAMNTPGQF